MFTFKTADLDTWVAAKLSNCETRYLIVQQKLSDLLRNILSSSSGLEIWQKSNDKDGSTLFLCVLSAMFLLKVL
jgi:hypothetical protein